MTENKPQDEQQRPGYMYDPEAPLPEHLRPKPEPEPRKRRLHDKDAAETAFKFKAFAWSLAAPVVGAGLGMNIFLRRPDTPWIIVPALALGLWVLAYFVPLWAAERGGRAASSVYFSSGSSTPALRQYSLADSFIVRGRFDDAAQEFERAAAAYPTDPEPCLRLARLLRDHMKRPEDAIRWFRRAMLRPGCDASTEIMATREVIDIYTHGLKTPSRALPHLARLAQKHAGTPAGEWARRELAETKRAWREEQTDV